MDNVVRVTSSTCGSKVTTWSMYRDTAGRAGAVRRPGVQTAESTGHDDTTRLGSAVDQAKEMIHSRSRGNRHDTHLREVVDTAHAGAHACLPPHAVRERERPSLRVPGGIPHHHFVEKLVSVCIPAVSGHTCESDDGGEAHEQLQVAISERFDEVGCAQDLRCNLLESRSAVDSLEPPRNIRPRTVDKPGDRPNLDLDLGDDAGHRRSIRDVAAIVVSAQTGRREVRKSGSDFVTRLSLRASDQH